MTAIDTLTTINPFANPNLGLGIASIDTTATASFGYIPMINGTTGSIDVSQYFGTIPTTLPTNDMLSVVNAYVQTLLGNIKIPEFKFPIYGQTESVLTNTKPSNDDLSSSSVQTLDKSEEVSTQGVFLKGKGRGSAYGPDFLKKVKQIAQNLNCNYRDLLAIFNSEFGVEANKTAKNGAVGLICFMPQYFDTKKIVKMTPIEQLDIVETTIKNAKSMAGFAPNAKLSKADLYALIFLPARAKNEVLCREGERDKNGKLLSFYESNKALDYNGDKKITKEEMAHRIDNKYVSDQSFLA